MDLASWVEHTAGWPPALVYAALFAGAFVEYVFPPFPGDTVVLVGAGLVGDVARAGESQVLQPERHQAALLGLAEVAHAVAA
ncbi:MAG: hypothetical protein ABMA64_40835, partial [Myxococcota bacterium]